MDVERIAADLKRLATLQADLDIIKQMDALRLQLTTFTLTSPGLMAFDAALVLMASELDEAAPTFD